MWMYVMGWRTKNALDRSAPGRQSRLDNRFDTHASCATLHTVDYANVPGLSASQEKLYAATLPGRKCGKLSATA